MCCVINIEPAHGTDCSNKLHTAMNVVLMDKWSGIEEDLMDIPNREKCQNKGI